MTAIIAGGRDYTFTYEDVVRLKYIHSSTPISAVVCGEARGADTEGKKWAEESGIKVISCPADWDAYGKSAGMIRNEVMAQIADAAILFPGGVGTDDMAKRAKSHGLKIYDYRDGLGLF